jgi:hypothetical protein
MQRLILKHLSGSKVNQVEAFSLSDLGELTIGRDPSATIRYDSNTDYVVSRQHAKIVRDAVDPTEFRILDLNSSNGTYVNSRRIAGTGRIAPGDIVQLGLGGPEFQFDLDPRPATGARGVGGIGHTNPAASDSPASMPTQIVGIGPTTGPPSLTPPPVRKESTPMPNNCPRCGAQNAGTAQSCYLCGTPLLPSAAPHAQSHSQPSGYSPPYFEQTPVPGRPASWQQPSVAPSAAATASGAQEGKLSKIGMTLGIIVACLMVVGLIPCLGWLNWFTLLLGAVAKILNWVAVFTENKIPGALNKAVIGLVLSTVAIFIGSIRLVLGAGCL